MEITEGLLKVLTKGLLKVDMTSGRLEVLANLATDTQVPLNYVNDLDVAPNGDVYFTSSTARCKTCLAKLSANTVRRRLVYHPRYDDTMKQFIWSRILTSSKSWRSHCHLDIIYNR